MSKVARFSSQLNLFAQVLSLETTVILLCTTEVCVYIPTNCSPPDFTVHGILQARILEWVAISFSRGFSQPRDQILWEDSLPSEPSGKS